MVDATWLWITEGPQGRTPEELAHKLATFVEHGVGGLVEPGELGL